MGQVTGIEWCDHTYNPWIGCTKVSPACDYCYAEAQEDRRVAGIAQIHQPHLLGPIQLQILKARHRARGDVGDRLAIRARHDQVLFKVVVQSAG